MKHPIRTVAALAPAIVLALGLAGCEKNPLLVKRSSCPAVAVPSYAGDITRFPPGVAPDAANIDMMATITNVRENCTETASQFQVGVTYDVVARRNAAGPARQVVLPVFVVVVQGGNVIQAKALGEVKVDFADNNLRGVGRGTATASVSRAAASLPEDIVARINRNRRAGDMDAATDPLADPEIRARMRAANFEVLLGFQLDERSLAYNVAR
ncbi:MAG: hypothetical protein WCO82_05745 [Sphingomonadales bacterium]